MGKKLLKVSGYLFRVNNSTIFIFVLLFKGGIVLTLWHSEQPKLQGVLVLLSAIASTEIVFSMYEQIFFYKSKPSTGRT